MNIFAYLYDMKSVRKEEAFGLFFSLRHVYDVPQNLNVYLCDR